MWWGFWAGLAVASPELFEEPAEATAVEVPPPTATWAGVGRIPPELARVVRDAANLPLPARLDAVSRALLDRPYVIDPLGEGVPPDPDPLARYDVFDCLTFVEEVLALSLAGDLGHVGAVRNALRYGDAPPGYAARRHFMELQWIPGNVDAGWLRVTTGDFGEVVHLERAWTAANWANWAGRAKFHHTDAELPVGTMALDVLPLATARAVADRIPPGSILLTVRSDQPWKPLWITHVGFVFRGDDGRAIVRHATKTSGRTRDGSLEAYLEKLETYPNWPVLGVAILEPIEAGPRRSAHH